MASVVFPDSLVFRRLHRLTAGLGSCIACKSPIELRDEMFDYAAEARIGLMCPCRSCMLIESGNPMSRRASAIMDVRIFYRRVYFRIRMLAWQWQTGRTLAGYWRG